MSGNDSAATGTTEKPLERRVFRLPEAGHILGGISRRMVHKLIDAGELDTVLVGSLRMVPRESIDAYLKRQRTKGRGEVPAA